MIGREAQRVEIMELRAEVERRTLLNIKLHAEVERLTAHLEPWGKRITKLEQALKRIKFRNEPGTTNHELAKEALS